MMATYTVEDPQTKKQVTFMWSDEKPPTDDDISQIFAEAGQMATSPAPSGGGFFSNLGNALSKRTQDIASQFSGPRADETNLQYQPLGRRTLQAGGAIAGGVGDVLTEGVKSLYNTFVPESVTQGIKDVAQSAWQALPQSVQNVAEDTTGYWGEKYQQFQQEYPEATKDIGAAVNIGTMIPITKGAQVGTNILSDAARLATYKTPAKIDVLIDAAIDQGVKKGIKPSVVGKSDAGLVQQYYGKAKTAVKDIVEANPEKLPRSLEDFSTSVRETKKQLYDQYHSMAVAAGKEGAMVDLYPLRSELYKIVESKNILRDAKESATRMLDNLADYDMKISPSVAEDLIASFNSKTKGFFKNPDYHSTGDALLTERTAKNLRRAVDDAIDNYQGPGYQELKNRYGAQTAIEKEVTDRATVNARKNLKGFFDLTDVVTSQEFIYGLMSMNPAHMVAAASGRGVKAYIKHINDPDKIITDMFDTVGKLQSIKNNALKMKTSVGQKAADWLYGGEKIPDISGARAPYLELPMPERGFTMKGEPYGPEILRPSPWEKPIDAEFTSRSYQIGRLPEPYNDTKLLMGQGFNLIDPALRDAYLKLKAEDFLKIGDYYKR